MMKLGVHGSRGEWQIYMCKGIVTGSSEGKLEGK